MLLFLADHAAGYLVKENYETLGQKDKAKMSLIIGIMATILIIGGLASIPEEMLEKIPNYIFPALYTLIIAIIVERIHGDILRNHKKTGGEFYSAWKALGVGAIAMIILFAGIAMVVFYWRRFISFSARFQF